MPCSILVRNTVAGSPTYENFSQWEPQRHCLLTSGCLPAALTLRCALALDSKQAMSWPESSGSTHALQPHHRRTPGADIRDSSLASRNGETPAPSTLVICAFEDVYLDLTVGGVVPQNTISFRGRSIGNFH